MWMPDPQSSASPQCPAPRGPPCKHCLHFRTSLKRPSSTGSAVGASLKPPEGEAGGAGRILSGPAPRTHPLPCGALCWQILESPQCLAPGNSEGRAPGLGCLLFDSGWIGAGDSDVCVDSGLGASRREMQSSSGLDFFFPTRRSAGRSGTRFHSGTEVVSFPDAGVPTATGTGGVAPEDPQQSSEEGASGCSALNGVRGNGFSTCHSPLSQGITTTPFIAPPFSVEESEVQR